MPRGDSWLLPRLSSVWTALLCAAAGCIASRHSSDESIRVDPARAAQNALELYDADGDQLLDKTELVRCPALHQALADFDSSGDGKISRDEIVGRLMRLAVGHSPLVPVSVSVTLDGRPLQGAAVRMTSVFALAKPPSAALGVTDAKGTAKMAVPADNLPSELQAVEGVPPGVYRVEVTHATAKLPARYNAESELGIEIDPASAEGKPTPFRLKSR